MSEFKVLKENDSMSIALEWIRENLKPSDVFSKEALAEHMENQKEAVTEND